MGGASLQVKDNAMCLSHLNEDGCVYRADDKVLMYKKEMSIARNLFFLITLYLTCLNNMPDLLLLPRFCYVEILVLALFVL